MASFTKVVDEMGGGGGGDVNSEKEEESIERNLDLDVGGFQFRPVGTTLPHSYLKQPTTPSGCGPTPFDNNGEAEQVVKVETAAKSMDEVKILSIDTTLEDTDAGKVSNDNGLSQAQAADALAPPPEEKKKENEVSGFVRVELVPDSTWTPIPVPIYLSNTQKAAASPVKSLEIKQVEVSGKGDKQNQNDNGSSETQATNALAPPEVKKKENKVSGFVRVELVPDSTWTPIPMPIYLSNTQKAAASPVKSLEIKQVEVSGKGDKQNQNDNGSSETQATNALAPPEVKKKENKVSGFVRVELVPDSTWTPIPMPIYLSNTQKAAASPVKSLEIKQVEVSGKGDKQNQNDNGSSETQATNALAPPEVKKKENKVPSFVRPSNWTPTPEIIRISYNPKADISGNFDKQNQNAYGGEKKKNLRHNNNDDEREQRRKYEYDEEEQHRKYDYNQMMKHRRIHAYKQTEAYKREVWERKAPYEIHPGLLKYWLKRHHLFSKYDEGIKLDPESWYSVTPESLAIHIAKRCAVKEEAIVLVDAFCGCGGNTIQFAKYCKKVIAIDIDPIKIELAKHNAGIYGVAEKIEFIVGDFMTLASTLTADVVFLSPPWGGPGYSFFQAFNLKTMIPMDGFEVFAKALTISQNIAYFLPKNVDKNQLDQLAVKHGIKTLEIESNTFEQHVKAKTIYFGDLCRKIVVPITEKPKSKLDNLNSSSN